jgi:putative tryptophan/tyrosine transport system substrate-binding protein
MTTRRTFIAGLGAAAAWPLGARGQQRGVPVIGYLNGASAWEFADQKDAFLQGLSGLGFVEGSSVSVVYEWAEGHYDRLPTMAADLVRRKVAVIATGSSAAALAAKAATTTIPVVFNLGTDPVGIGLVPQLNRPGGNLTGVTLLSVEVGPKKLELMHELIPSATTIAVLINPTAPDADTDARDMQTAATRAGLQLQVLHASTERDFDTVFASLTRMHAGGLVIASDVFFSSRKELLAELAVRHGVPSIYQFGYAAAGGLMSYGADNLESSRLVGVYVGRILKGERPADLPIQQATKVQLTINLKTAKALGLTVPPALLGRADEVIE